MSELTRMLLAGTFALAMLLLAARFKGTTVVEVYPDAWHVEAIENHYSPCEAEK